MVAKTFKWEEHHFDYVRRIFGQAGVDLLARTPAYATDERRSHVVKDDNLVRLMLRDDDFEDTFVFIHEFGHLWHAVHHPDLSETAPEARVEAAAYLCELRLANDSPILAGLLADRARCWLPAGAVIASRVPSHVKLPDAVGRVLRGCYG